jgi:hypothetical protein
MPSNVKALLFHQIHHVKHERMAFWITMHCCLPRHPFHHARVSITLQGIALILLNSENRRAWSSNEPGGTNSLHFFFLFLKEGMKKKMIPFFSLLTLHKQHQYCNFYNFPRFSKVRSFPLATVREKKNDTLLVLMSTKHISKESLYEKFPLNPKNEGSTSSFNSKIMLITFYLPVPWAQAKYNLSRKEMSHSKL